jgi:hypothetical protein
MFKTAKAIAPAKAAAKNTKREVHVANLKQLAELNALQDAIAGIQSQLAASIKEFALDTFVEDGNKIERRPENFRGIDGIASASVELRKRASTSPLNADQLALVEKYGMKAEKLVTTNKMFGINPAYAEDDKLLAAVETALAGIVPDDFIVLQEEKSKMVVTDQMIDEAFKKGVPREVVETVTVLALKPKLEVTDMTEILASVQTLLAA